MPRIQTHEVGPGGQPAEPRSNSWDNRRRAATALFDGSSNHPARQYDALRPNPWYEEDWGFLAFNWATLSYFVVLLLIAGATGSFVVFFVGFMLPILAVGLYLLAPFV